MPMIMAVGDYIARESVYVLYDGERCLYVGDSRTGRAGVAGRIVEHLKNAGKRDESKRVGKLHVEINNSVKNRDCFLNWRLEIYSLSDCVEKTGKHVSTVKEAQQVMIEHLNPKCNVHKK
ncbi:hypothetical protein [Vibrio vulnificus]|uniref:hypothetical protein n=1 Tax=Vibrio vulnificus TaxID=672 RepID=UPI003242C234